MLSLGKEPRPQAASTLTGSSGEHKLGPSSRKERGSSALPQPPRGRPQQ